MKTMVQRPGLSDGLALVSLSHPATTGSSITLHIVLSSSKARFWLEMLNFPIWLTNTQVFIGMLWTHMISLMKKTSKMSSTSMLSGKLRWMVMSPSEFKAHLPIGVTLLKNSAIRVSMTLHGMMPSNRQTIPSVGQLHNTKIGRKWIRLPCHGLIPGLAGAAHG